MAKVVDGRQAKFFWIDNRVLNHYGPTMGPHGIAVYCCLALHANQRRESFPSYRKITAFTGMGRTKVSAALRTLVELGLVKIKRYRDGGPKRANVYVLTDPPEPDMFTPAGPDLDQCDGPEVGLIDSPKVGLRSPEVGLIDSPKVGLRSPEVGLIDSPKVGLELDPLEQDPRNKTQLEQEPPNPQGGQGPSPELQEEFPTELDTQAFRAVWADWQRYRREIKHPLKPTGIRQQLRKLASWGVTRAIMALETSMANGWQGVFEPEERHDRRSASHLGSPARIPTDPGKLARIEARTIHAGGAVPASTAEAGAFAGLPARIGRDRPDPARGDPRSGFR